MKNSMADERNLVTIAKIENQIDSCLKINDHENFQKKAELLMQALTEFKSLLRELHQKDFAYYDVLKEEQSSYMRRCVTILDNFTAAAFHIPFTILSKAASCVVTIHGKKLPYPEKLKLGNPAIGQAWLANGKEVFSPREAIQHSIDASAIRLQKWVKEFHHEIERALYGTVTTKK